MDPDWFASPHWWHALTLSERSAVGSDSQAAWASPDESSERGRRRLERWRTQPPFTADSYFAQRLVLDGIRQEDLLSILSEPVESLKNRLAQTPAWLAQLAAAFSHPVPAPVSPSSDTPIDDTPIDETPLSDDPAPGEEILGFLELVQPLIDQACDRLQVGVTALLESGGALPFDPDTIEDVLFMNLPDPLLMRLSRTLVLELHVARLRGLLEGDTPEARFESFIRRLGRAEDTIAILAEYPVLSRQLIICINQWADLSLEFLNRLCADWDTIRNCFCPHDDPGKLIELAGGAGDTHRGGRSVMIAEFGSGFRLVYKPKSLAIDVHFQELLAWLNQRGCQPPLYTLNVLDRGEYGWVAYVAHQGCSASGEVTRFYQRHGAYLALLYALNANDFHFENVIAVGEHPILVDLETLLQPQFDTFDETRAGIAAAKVMADSVLQVALLPARTWSSGDFAGIDISGLGGTAGQLSPDRLPQLIAGGTDAMHYVRERVPLSGDAHRPTLNDEEINAAEYVGEVVAGFNSMYRLLMDNRAHLLASDGPLHLFAQDEIRILLRQTRTYDQLLFESFHPDMLRDALERDRFLDRLWTAVPERAYLARMIKAEQKDLQQGDIPLFTTHPSTLDIYSALGERMGGVLSETGMTVVQRRLHQLSEADLRRQVWFIRASFATADAGVDRSAGPAFLPAQAKTPVTRARLLAGVAAIADRLVVTSIHGAEDVSWIGLERVDEQNWTIQPLGIDLYGGIAGITLFFAYAGAVLHEDRYTAVARRAVNTLMWQIEMLRTEMLEIGGFEGWGGVLYTLTHLGMLWDDKEVLSQAEDLVDVLAELVSQDDRFDVARGAAGAIVSLLAFYQCVPLDKALRAAIACGDHLMASAQPKDHGMGWVIPQSGTGLPIGFGHGIAGIAWALLELAEAIGNEQYRVAAQQAVDYERSLQTSADKDRPEMPGRDVPAAVEIGVARLCMLRYLDDLWLYEDLQVAVNAARTWDAGRPHSLDQGAMGNLELLLLATRRLNGDRRQVETDRLAAMIMDSIEQNGWHCGGPQAVEVPGLMLGLAGIGYQMLRLAEPERVPSVLVLAPPTS